LAIWCARREVSGASRVQLLLVFFDMIAPALDRYRKGGFFAVSIFL